MDFVPCPGESLRDHPPFTREYEVPGFVTITSPSSGSLGPRRFALFQCAPLRRRSNGAFHHPEPSYPAGEICLAIRWGSEGSCNFPSAPPKNRELHVHLKPECSSDRQNDAGPWLWDLQAIRSFCRFPTSPDRSTSRDPNNAADRYCL